MTRPSIFCSLSLRVFNNNLPLSNHRSTYCVKQPSAVCLHYCRYIWYHAICFVLVGDRRCSNSFQTETGLQLNSIRAKAITTFLDPIPINIKTKCIFFFLNKQYLNTTKLSVSDFGKTNKVKRKTYFRKICQVND